MNVFFNKQNKLLKGALIVNQRTLFLLCRLGFRQKEWQECYQTFISLQTLGLRVLLVKLLVSLNLKSLNPSYSCSYYRSHSWQAHLKRISCSLFPSKVWWNTTPEGFLFSDGDNDPEHRVEGPDLCHFPSCSIQDVENLSEENRNRILQLKLRFL